MKQITYRSERKMAEDVIENIEWKLTEEQKKILDEKFPHIPLNMLIQYAKEYFRIILCASPRSVSKKEKSKSPVATASRVSTKKAMTGTSGLPSKKNTV